MADAFKALSDPTRREILGMLGRREMTAGAIAENFTISKPSVSHHLSVLREAGLVSAERRGQEIVYALDTTVVQDVLAWVLSLAGGDAVPGRGRAGSGPSGRSRRP